MFTDGSLAENSLKKIRIFIGNVVSIIFASAFVHFRRHALNKLFGIPDTFSTQLIIILFAIALYTISAISGLTCGMHLLSRFNVMLAFALMVFILIFAPTNFIINGYIQGVGGLVDNFIPIATYRGDEGWLSW